MRPQNSSKYSVRFSIAPLLLVILCACSSAERTSLEAGEKEFQDLVASEQSQHPNWDGLKAGYENLRTRLKELETSSSSSISEKAKSLLMLVEDKLKRVYEEIDYAKLKQAEQQLGSADSYEALIQQAQDLLNLLGNFSQRHPSSSKPIPETKARIQSLLESAYNEKYEYVQLSSSFKDTYTFEEASAGLNAISGFVQKHPNSIMNSFLSQKADGIRVVKAKIWAQQEFKSISSLNTAIQEVNKLITETTASDSQAVMQSLITSLQDKKSEVFKTEVAERTNELMTAMRTAALNSAKTVHPLCSNSNDPASVVDEKRNVIGARIEIFRAYVIRTSGDLFCSSTYLVRVNVDGYLTGDEKVGVSQGITSSRVIVDGSY